MVEHGKEEAEPATFLCKQGTCYLCGEVGHYKRNCLKLHENMHGKFNRRKMNYRRGRGRIIDHRGRYM